MSVLVFIIICLKNQMELTQPFKKISAVILALQVYFNNKKSFKYRMCISYLRLI